MDQFTVGRRWETARDGRTTVVVVLTGEFDITARDKLADALVKAVADCRADVVVVDLAAATFIDSEALGAILAGYTAAQAAGKPYRLVNPGEWSGECWKSRGCWIFLVPVTVRNVTLVRWPRFVDGTKTVARAERQPKREPVTSGYGLLRTGGFVG